MACRLRPAAILRRLALSLSRISGEFVGPRQLAHKIGSRPVGCAAAAIVPQSLHLNVLSFNRSPWNIGEKKGEFPWEFPWEVLIWAANLARPRL